MKILIDIYHIPQYNLFKNVIKSFNPNDVDLCCVNRGKLVSIIKKECPEYNLYIFGDYKKNHGRLSLAFRIVLPRLYQLFRLLKKKNYQVVATASYQANFIARILGIPNFSVMDDPRGFVVKILNFSTKDFYLPLFNKKYGKAKNFKALKEWAYLSPKYFSPSKKVLQEYGLERKKYIFIREVVTNTSNYIGQERNLALSLIKQLDKNIKIVVSLEDKAIKDLFPDNCIILEEPVSDIHSIMYYSKLVVSSGDSMAREGGMLGVPSIYLGNRDMPANNILIDKKILFKMDINESLNFIKKLDYFKLDQEEFRIQLKNEWEDVSELILQLINKYK